MIADTLSDAIDLLYEAVYVTYREERVRLPDALRAELISALEAVNEIRSKIDEHQLTA